MITVKGVLGDGFDMFQSKKICDAIEKCESIFNNKAFMSLVCGAEFTQTNDSAIKVYETIMAIPDKLFKICLNNIPNGSETAATNTVTGITSLQIEYIDKCSLKDLINTLMHEYTHTPEGGGYTHSYLYSRWIPYLKLRPWSVPYQVGDIAESLCE